MFRFVVLAALISLSMATVVDKCITTLPAVQIEGCDASPCKIKSGEELHIQVDLTLEQSVKALNTKISVISRGSIFNYHLPQGYGNVCDHLLGGASCPLAANQKVTYNLSIPMTEYMPSGINHLNVYSEDENSELVTCFGFHVLVI